MSWLGESAIYLDYVKTGNYEQNDQEMKEHLSSYLPEEYKMRIQRGLLLSLYDPVIMTKDKIEVCEALDIYLLGDVNQNGELEYDDVDKINRRASVPIGFRGEAVADLNADTAIGSNDTSVLYNILPMVTYREVFEYFHILEDEFDKEKEKFINQYIENLGVEIDWEKAENWEDEAYSEWAYGIWNEAEEAWRKSVGTVKEVNEIQNYIPSYVDETILPYPLIIHKGELWYFWVAGRNIENELIRRTIGHVLGDVNGDYQLDEIDLSRLETYLNKKRPPIRTENADINGDDIVDSKDLELLKQMLGQEG